MKDVGRAIGAILDGLAGEARHVLGDSATADLADTMDTATRPDSVFGRFLARWSAADPRPLVLLIDEIDALVGDTLVSVLRQLRAGYVERPERFPQSVVLCGNAGQPPGRPAGHVARRAGAGRPVRRGVQAAP